MLAFQSGVAVLGVILAALFGLFSRTPWFAQDGTLWSANWFGAGLGISTTMGLLVAGLLFGLIYGMSQRRFVWIREIESLIDGTFLPLLQGRSLVELALLSLLAGVGEEVLFRWAIQGGLEAVLLPQAHPLSAWLIATILSSTLFGLAHFVTPGYFFLTLIIGWVMSLLVVFGGGLWAPILAHAVYDFIALFWMLRRETPSHPTVEPVDPR